MEINIYYIKHFLCDVMIWIYFQKMKQMIILLVLWV